MQYTFFFISDDQYVFNLIINTRAHWDVEKKKKKVHLSSQKFDFVDTASKEKKFFKNKKLYVCVSETFNTFLNRNTFLFFTFIQI